MTATETHTTTDFEPAIKRLREIAAESGDHLLLGDGEPHPDAKLLAACAEIAQQRKVAAQAFAAWREIRLGTRVEGAAAYKAYKTETGRLGRLLREACKLKATTGAGIYAKAIAVARSESGAAKLGASLAQDLLDQPKLRATLWNGEPA